MSDAQAGEAIPPVIYLLGYPGVGKASIAARLCEASGAELLDNHRWNAQIFPKYDFGDHDPVPEAALREVDAARTATISHLREHPQTFRGAVFTNKLYAGNPQHEARYREVAETSKVLGAELIIFNLQCEPEEALRRGQEASRAERKKLVDPVALSRERNTYEMMSIDHPVQVDLDITSYTAEQSAICIRLISNLLERMPDNAAITPQQLANRVVNTLGQLSPSMWPDIRNTDNLEERIATKIFSPPPSKDSSRGQQ